MNLKTIGLAVLSAMVTAAAVAGPASATTLEENGVKRNAKTELTTSLEIGTSLKLLHTNGTQVFNTCTTSHVLGATVNPFTATKLAGAFGVLTFENCTRPVTVHKAGTFTIEHIAGTNGKVRSIGAEVTFGTAMGTLTCVTGEGTDLGTLTGKGGGEHATLDVKTAINCGFIAPSATLEASYWVTTPTGIGVVA